MPTFKELIRDKKVAKHPLLRGYRNLPKMRDNINKHAQALGEELTDMLSQGYQPEEKPKNLHEMVREASMIVQDAFSQFDIPVTPKFFYETSRDLKHARNDETRVVEGSLIFGAEFRSTLGVRKRATVPIAISAGELIPPSVMEIDGRIYVVAQSSIDEILDRNQTYYTEPLRESYQSPPLNRFEREMAVDMKVSQGPQPRKNPGSYYMNQKNVEARRKGQKDLDMDYLDHYFDQMSSWVAEQGYELIDEPRVGHFGNVEYPTNEEGVSLSVFEGSVDVSDKDTASTLELNLFKNESQVASTYFRLDDPFSPHELSPSSPESFGNKLSRRRKVAIGGTPRMWAQVVEAMEKAEDDGKDTFPRSWIHVLRNYILDFVSTASKDAWEPHLINAGFCLNPYGKVTNRGRMTAQAIQGDFEKEVEMEVDQDGIEQLLDEEPEALEAPGHGPKGPKMYQDTKTPIESGDGVKVRKGPGGQGFQGTIVEVDEDGDYLIIKSKGMEYRVTVDDIEPVPSTFKKMYM